MYVEPTAVSQKHSNLRWIWEYGKPDKWSLVISLILFAFDKVATLIPPLIAGVIVDECITRGITTRLVPLLVVFVASNLGHMLLRYIYEIMMQRFGQNVLYRLVSDEFEKLHSLDFQYFNHTDTGDLMNRMTSDTEAIRFFISWAGLQLVDSAIMLLSALGMMFYLNWILALVLTLITPLFFFVVRRMSKSSHRIFYSIRQSLSRLNDVVEENIEANRVVKAFAREPYENEKFEEHNQDFLNKNMDLAYNNAKFMPLIDGISYIIDFVILILGGVLALMGNMRVGTLVSFMNYQWMVDMPLRMSGWLLNDYQRFNASCIKIRRLLGTSAMISDDLSAFSGHKDLAQRTIQGDIRFEHVSFAFPDDPDTLVLNDVSFHIRPGEKLGVLGETGSGKSTLVALIARFYDPTSGHVYIDDIDARFWPLEKLRSEVTLAFQETFLFSDTIGQNIVFGASRDEEEVVYDDPVEAMRAAEIRHKNSVDSAFVRSMARIADADDFIQSMPEKYDTVVGERGVGLSGGQKQRISLARALADNPSVLIMDDTTSAVDMETEGMIQKNLRELAGGKTVVTIAYRISSVRDADQILVIDHGKIVERGDHKSLVAAHGMYWDIYSRQMGLQLGDIATDNLKKLGETEENEKAKENEETKEISQEGGR
ncbi:MAG: ABC transporter ATP-binding protein [Aeriscardovia aeriphila]|nr:ABC transporter ATP-binding protein [Aeriscardovia aeriphila]